MHSRVWSSAVQGVDALPIEIETHTRGGVPRFSIVGLPDGAVRESRDRIMAALRSADLPRPRGILIVNLAPADVRKEGAAFDLPIALGLVATAEDLVSQEKLDELVVVGELGLDGQVRPVRGVLPMAVEARKSGKSGIIVPHENAAEAGVVHGLEVYAVSNIAEAYKIVVQDADAPQPVETDAISLFHEAQQYNIDFSEVRGQQIAKRALEVAAAGGHNLLMVGPPGAGKTMLARRLPTILPPLTMEEALETTKILSVGGKLRHHTGLVATRPFRAPHHTISDAGLCGGGANPQPGEISCAHNGILFLDELPEFKRQVLEVMRQPLEEGHITISRARFSVSYPARFMLIASMNPCPCGNLTNPVKECLCSPVQVQRYLSRISGPLLDRIDVHVEVMPVPFEEMSTAREEEKSELVRQRVIAARNVQHERFQGEVHCNAQMGSRHVRRFCRLSDEGKNILKLAIDRLGLSARAYDRILKVSRTIADLEPSDAIKPMHVSEAIQYRALDRKWGEMQG